MSPRLRRPFIVFAAASLLATSTALPALVAAVTGSGLFAAPVTYAAGTNPHAVMSADLNGDGKPDLVVTNSHSDGVGVFLGNGNGTFAAETEYSSGPTNAKPKFTAAADMNGDGKLDLVVADQDTDQIAILLGDGHGVFGAPMLTAAGCSKPHEVATGDFNGDGKVDVAAACWGGSVISVFLGIGDGTLGPVTNYTTGAAPHSLAVADFNGDGKPDLAVANHDANSIGILLGLGGGSFGTVTNYPVGTQPHAVRVADLNGDGKLDLVAPNDGSNNVSILLGTGTGTFGSATNFAVGLVPKSVAIADFNGDGKLDLAVSNTAGNGDLVSGNPGGDNVSILLGNGDGTFQLATTDFVGPTPFSVIAVDLNGDGLPDLATANWDGNNVSVLLNSTGPPPDTTPPTVTGFSPANGATGVAPGVAPTAMFSESVNPTTVTSSTFTLTDQASATLVTGTVAYSDPSKTATFTPGAALGAGKVYAARVKGGASGVKDLAGNALVADVTWTFTIEPPAILPDTTPPTAALGVPALLNAAVSTTPSVLVREAWTGSDDRSGVASFEVARSIDGRAFVGLSLSSPLQTSRSDYLAPAHTYRYEVRATDGVGNVGSWTLGPTFSIGAAQETTRAISYSRSWVLVSANRSYGGRLKYAVRSGASATYAFTGRSIAWVAPTSSLRGSAKVYVDGIYRGTVSLYAAKSHVRQVVFALTLPSGGAHTIRIVARGTAHHPRVDIDAFIVLR